MAVPVITSLSPASGATAGGTTVTIAGSNLSAVTAVTFGATPAADFAILSATQIVAISPGGSGIVSLDVTNADGDSEALSYQFTDGLFTEAEARAYDRGQLSDGAKFTTAEIAAKEAEIRAFFIQVCGVDFFPTTHTDERHSGDGTAMLLLKWPRVTSVTAASTRSLTSWTALTAGELANIQCEHTDTGMIYREGGYWPAGVNNIKVTYVAGYTTVPLEVKDAALKIAVTELPDSNVSFSAESYEAGGMSVSYAAGDGFNGAWHRIPEVRRAIRLYTVKNPGVV